MTSVNKKIAEREYSLVPFNNSQDTQDSEIKHSDLPPKNETTDEQKTFVVHEISKSKMPTPPEMWFNPATNRWCSKSCRRYREIIRDQERVKRGLPPGPQQNDPQKRHKKRKRAPTPEQTAPTPSPAPSQPTPSSLPAPQPQPRTARDIREWGRGMQTLKPNDPDFKRKRDEYFAMFGL